MSFSLSGTVFPLLLTAALISAPAVTGPAQEDPGKNDGKEAEEETVVITEDDLVERYGAPEPPPKVRSTETELPPSPAGKVARKETGEAAAAADRDRARKVARIEEEIARLNKRIASLRNPYLPRVETTEGERERESGMDAAGRVRDLQDRIAALETELSSLRKVKPAPATAGR